jgi:predicted nucleotide-binding protein (sugar kinase/HSP70/actin superfamily)
MQVTTILNCLPLSWEHVIALLTHSKKGISIIFLPVLLVLEEERMKKRREGQSNNFMIT